MDFNKDSVISILKTIYDPEIPINIWDLGLIYNIEIQESGEIIVTMTLTSPNCPVAESLPPSIAKKIGEATKSPNVKVNVVWDPPWSRENLSEAAQLTLGLW